MSDDRIYYCATDMAALKATGSRGWPEQPVYWHTSGGAGHVSANDFRDITHYALQDFMDKCGIQLVYTSNIKTANVVMRGGTIDGRGKVLAQSHLPIGLRRNSDFTVQQEYDSEAWSSEEVAPSGKISMPAVIRHECGHGLGALEHAPENSGALMRPFIDHKVSKLQAWDIRELQKIYGPPKATPAPTPTPTPSGQTIIRFRGQVDLVEITDENGRPTHRITKLA